ALSDGQIKVTAPDTEDVHLVLNGVTVTSSSSAPLLIEAADTVYVTLAADTENTLTDKAGSTATIGTGTDATTIDGTIFSKTDLTINGTGSLTINGNTNHGIVSKDDLSIVSGTYQITAAGQGLSGKDSVKIKDGTFTLNTGKDSIQSDNADEEGKGFVYISGGTFIIDSQGDAIQAETLLQVDDGEFDIVTGGGSENAPVTTTENEGFGGPMGNNSPDVSAETPIEDADTTAETTSTKGLKSGAELIVNGGTFTIDSVDDGIHSDGNVTLAAGAVTVSTGDDGVHADGELLLSGADLTVAKSNEGVEGKTITVNTGDILITASDDGFNAASGSSDETATSEPSGQDPFSSNSDNAIMISGGTITVDAAGDGLDSNGTLEISGGNITISGPENDGNGTIDSNGETVITGGTLMGTGSSGMAVSFADTSSQASVLYGFDTV
ncbi:MAG: carbohydrate-binding domain-containing protein, partial [Eubacterium sp.]